MSASSGARRASRSLVEGGFVTRFAPSPTGYLHRGHAFSAMTASRAADAARGRFLLRIEDLDTQRCRPEFEAAIFEDLSWLGLTWETPVVRQSERTALYRAALARLQSKGLVYPCRRTRREILDGIARAPHAGDPGDDRVRGAVEGPVAWRLSIEAAERALGGFDRLTFEEAGERVSADPRSAGDVVLGRKDSGVSYHLAVVVDDAAQGVTHVIRGDDLLPATHVQRLLQELLDLPAPAYRHHPLVVRPDGKRFAKRDTAETLRELRAKGVGPDRLCAELGF